MDMNLQFDLPKEQSSIIKVIGVGGGGSNAVNHMFDKGIRGVNYVICNTDQQALDISPIPNKIQLGPEITQGLGAGSRPEVGEKATFESEAVIKDLLEKNTRMVFITAGMGGGTGTGGAPVVAKIAKEMGILTVGIVTTPFSFEGRRKLKQADEGIKKMKEYVDSIIVISNDKIREIFGNLSKSEAFSRADDILSMAAKSISEIITVPGEINVDFADVEYVMKDSGVSIMGTAMAEGDDRAMRAVHTALNSPLLNDNNITGARNILINISSGAAQVTIDEITAINDFVQDAAGNDTDIIFGTCDDMELGDKLSVTIIATGFVDANQNPVEVKREVVNLVKETPTPPPAAEPTVNEIIDFTVRDESTNEVVETNSETANADTATSDEGSEFTLFNFDEETSKPENADIANEENVDESLDFVVKEKEPEKTDDESYGFYTTKKDQPTEPAKPSPQNNEDRVRRLKDVSYKWDNMTKIQELENRPAYERRGVNLDDVPHSSEQNVSRFTLDSYTFNGENRPEIRKNNSFLNDNVD